MAELDKMRIVNTVKPGANPELFEDLSAMPREDRSERMRTLATLGVLAMRGRLAPTGVEIPASRQPEPEEAPRADLPSDVLAGFDDTSWGDV